MQPGRLIFDDLSTWEAGIVGALGTRFSSRLSALTATHQYVEDSMRSLLAVDMRGIVHATLEWIKQHSITAYHGTRLTVDELQSVRINGLEVLNAEARKVRLERALSSHPNWLLVSQNLAREIDMGKCGVSIGKRTGQAHLTLSRAGLESGFNHYLTHGSEFDNHIAHQLLGEEGVNLLAHDGVAYILEFSVPGGDAIVAAHRHFSPEEMIERGEVPNIVREFLKVLSYRVSHPEFYPADLRADCGLIFSSNIPASWLSSTVNWENNEL